MAKSDLAKAFGQIAKAIKQANKSLAPAAQFAINIITLRTQKGLDANGQRFAPYTEAYYNWKYFKGKTHKFLQAKAARAAQQAAGSEARILKASARSRSMLGEQSLRNHAADLASIRKATAKANKAAALLAEYEAGKTVDLTLTGHMLGSMVGVVTGPDEITIEFSGAEEIAKAIGNSKKRDFFDVRLDKELDAIAEVIAENLVDEMLK